MQLKRPYRAISGDTYTKGPTPIVAPGASYAVEFSRLSGKIPLLPLNAADCAAAEAVMIEKEEDHEKYTLVRELLPVH